MKVVSNDWKYKFDSYIDVHGANFCEKNALMLTDLMRFTFVLRNAEKWSCLVAFPVVFFSRCKTRLL